MEKSYFDGTILQHFGYSLLAGMFTAITFGIGAPWASCGLHRWETKHTVVESKRLEFDGKGLQLLGLYLKLIFLPILILLGTLLILRPFVETKIGSIIGGLVLLALLILSIFYGSFVVIQLKKWIISHTHFQVHIIPGTYETAPQSVPGYEQPTPAPAPRPIPQQRTPERDWTDKIAPVLPMVYVVWFCGIAVAVFFLLKLIFK